MFKVIYCSVLLDHIENIIFPHSYSCFIIHYIIFSSYISFFSFVQMSMLLSPLLKLTCLYVLIHTQNSAFELLRSSGNTAYLLPLVHLPFPSIPLPPPPPSISLPHVSVTPPPIFPPRPSVHAFKVILTHSSPSLLPVPEFFPSSSSSSSSSSL